MGTIHFLMSRASSSCQEDVKTWGALSTVTLRMRKRSREAWSKQKLQDFVKTTNHKGGKCLLTEQGGILWKSAKPMLLLIQNGLMRDLIFVPEDTVRVGCRLLTNSICHVKTKYLLFQKRRGEKQRERIGTLLKMNKFSTSQRSAQRLWKNNC